MSNLRVSVSPLTGRIYCGKLNKARNAFLDGKVDVTSDVMAALIEKAKYHGGAFDIEGGGQKWSVTVTKESAP